jgi:hypothetical protein
MLVLLSGCLTEAGIKKKELLNTRMELDSTEGLLSEVAAGIARVFPMFLLAIGMDLMARANGRR